ncbi:hypothetical protein EON77_05520 [bacterium]|nr:MAG: hypothetical protein EON77_05520 [bacterium]
MGLRIRRGASYHGLAFNIDMDLSPFQRINPCGMAGLEVTQLATLAPPAPSLPELADELGASLLERFSRAAAAA